MDEGAKGYTLLQIDLRASEEAIADYEWVQEDFSFAGEIVSATYREWLMPASLLNSHGNTKIIPTDSPTIEAA
jgi:hypothetical protein